MRKQKVSENKQLLKRAIKRVEEQLKTSQKSFSPKEQDTLKKKRKALIVCRTKVKMECEQFQYYINAILEEKTLPEVIHMQPKHWNEWQGFFLLQYNDAFTRWRKSHVEVITKTLLLASRSNIR